MKDNELIKLLCDFIDAGLTANGWNIFSVQKDQPTQQGIPTAPTVFVEKLFDHKYGWPVEKRTYVPPVAPATQGTYSYSEGQWYETSIQVSALAMQDPATVEAPTASDIVKYVSQYLNGRTVRAALRLQNVKMLRITDVNNPWFEDERLSFEAAPSFQLTIQHMLTIASASPATNIVQELPNGIYRV